METPSVGRPARFVREMDATRPLDAPFLDRTDAALARPLHSAIAGARADVRTAAQHLRAIGDDALAKPWGWIGGSEEEIRYGAYRAGEALELAEIEARSALATADGDETDAARILGPATAARWDLHGLLAGLPEELLDADPGGGEWTIRLTLGHVINGQRGYAWGTAWWLDNPHDDRGTVPSATPDELWETFPDEATTEAEGTLDDLRARLDGVLDLAAERLAGVPNERLRLLARWSGFIVTVGFRLGRWSSHIREHTIQIEKTLAMLGHGRDESERLGRLVLAAYGRAESAVFGRAAGPGLDTAAGRVAEAAEEAREATAAARDAATSGA